MIVNARAQVANIPDAIFVSNESLVSGRVRYVDAGRPRGVPPQVEGIPDWLAEIVSSSSVEKDTRRLRLVYHRAGIPEYWLIDARGEEVVLQILVRRPRRYVAVRPHDGWYHSPTFNYEFRMDRVHRPVGGWRYKLHVR
jgi:Uma2 family endonuclease